MDWKIYAIKDLRRYKFIKLGIINSKERLAIIDAEIKTSLHINTKRCARKKTELMAATIEANNLRQSISSAERKTKLLERALDSLTELERNILAKFYMDNNPKPASVLSDELGFSVRSLYRARDEALEKFTLAMYGIDVS